uniref:Uncharacterized protein n=1 Tax=Anguilla anguilla TaxID=7936 RepID=A0A0E9QVI3_ANGAN
MQNKIIMFCFDI